jgi:hypothetical protein
MIGFEVTINGTKLCTAGIGEPGDLQVNVIWVLRHSQEDFTGTPGTADETLSITVHGKAYAGAEYIAWPNTNLQVGDEVSIRVVEREGFDSPAGRAVIDREKAETYQRELYERLKRKYESAGHS